MSNTEGQIIKVRISSESSTINEVFHDNTLTGTGQPGNELGVAESVLQDIARKISDVQVNGETVVEDNVANIEIGNAAITIQKNGIDIDSFTANETTDKTINIEVPTTLRELSTVAEQRVLDSGITSSGVEQITVNENNIANINEKIPSQASSENKLADKNFVNSSVATNTSIINGHIADKNNPHQVTKAQVGLGNVDNTSDTNKPVSTAQQTALNAKANTALNNLTSTGANIGNWSSNVTNCITEIPQDINLGVNSTGSLILKAGSKVYIPNGPGVFTPVTMTADHELMAPATDRTTMLVVDANGNFNWRHLVSECFSGTTAPTGHTNMLWYDTTNNVIKMTNDGGTTWSTTNFSFPVCIATRNVTTCIIDQVFNGFGFIGSTVFALPGVKGLVPNGRNTDGTLKNITATISDVRTVSATNSDNKCVVLNNQGDIFIANGNFESETKPSKNWSYWYKPSENVAYNTQSGTPNLVYQMPAVSFVADNSSKITSFNPKTVFHAVDYNDTDFIANCAMPSDRYMDLTLPTSGQTVIAPADGYYTVSKSSTADNQYISIANNTSGLNVSEFIPSGAGCRVFIPVSKGDVVTINYTLAGTTNWFRFIYANGAK